jgi:Mrp family chromosome partitioning ATPase
MNAAKVVADALQPGDVFFTVGAGDIDLAGPEVLRLLRERERSPSAHPEALEGRRSDKRSPTKDT